MCIESIQVHAENTWRYVQPYIVPASFGVGITYIISQIWGAQAAAFFAAAAVGFTATFPSVITQINKDDVLVNLARLVLIVTLPIFGVPGVIMSIGLVATSFFAQDVRLYEIREKLSKATVMLDNLAQKGQERLQKRKEMIAEYTQKNDEAKKILESIRELREEFRHAGN
jgi:hypothetical protein